jgi:hypothetical protein
MKKTILRFGLYGALTIVTLFLLTWFLLKNSDFAFSEALGYLTMIVSLSFVFFGIKSYRDNENSGKVTLKQALILGILISLITAVAFGIIDVIYIKYINPDFTETYYNEAIEEMRNTLSSEQFELKLKELEAQKEMFSNTFFSFALMSGTVLVIGFIISLISALILQRK